jgi:hypothetical protein
MGQPKSNWVCRAGEVLGHGNVDTILPAPYMEVGAGSDTITEPR